jgi:hypothetical protein
MSADDFRRARSARQTEGKRYPQISRRRADDAFRVAGGAIGVFDPRRFSQNVWRRQQIFPDSARNADLLDPTITASKP